MQTCLENTGKGIKKKIKDSYRKQIKAKWIEDYKKTLKCLKCGEGRFYCIDFHHNNYENKEFSVSSMARGGFSIDKIKKEIEKCSPLCSNCHREWHYLETRDKEIKFDNWLTN